MCIRDRNNKAKQDNEAEPDIDEDSLIPDSPMFRMYLEAVSYTHLSDCKSAAKRESQTLSVEILESSS